MFNGLKRKINFLSKFVSSQKMIKPHDYTRDNISPTLFQPYHKVSNIPHFYQKHSLFGKFAAEDDVAIFFLIISITSYRWRLTCETLNQLRRWTVPY